MCSIIFSFFSWKKQENTTPFHAFLDLSSFFYFFFGHSFSPARARTRWFRRIQGPQPRGPNGFQIYEKNQGDKIIATFFPNSPDHNEKAKPLSTPCAIIRKSDTNHYPPLNQYDWEILHDSISIPQAIIKKSYVNHHLLPRQLLRDPI